MPSGSISGELVEPGFIFWRDIIDQNTHDEIKLARYNVKPKKLRLGNYRTQTRPSEQDIYHSHIRSMIMTSDWLIANVGTVMTFIVIPSL